MEQPPFPQDGTPSARKNILPLTLLLILLSVGFLATFFSGYYLHGLFAGEKATVVTNSHPTPSPDSNKDEAKQPGFLPGKHYFENTIFFFAKSDPHKTFIATVTRSEQENSYVQVSRISYFDGAKWIRKAVQNTTMDSLIVSNSLLKSWNSSIDQTRVLKESLTGTFQVGGDAISFSSGELLNEIGIRSLPGYTKFFSVGREGVLTIGNISYPSYVLFSNIYSLNASDIQFYNQPFGVTTDWVGFWTEDGSFYHVDKTSVDKPTEIYNSHAVGVWEKPDQSVAKTFSVSLDEDKKDPPEIYSVQFGGPINAVLHMQRLNEVNKAPSNAFSWHMGQVQGEIIDQDGISHKGVGLVEYIHH